MTVKITDYPADLTHKDCGGQVHSVEAVFIVYEIQSDGNGGYEYTGNHLDYIPMNGMENQFECHTCGKYADQVDCTIEGTEVIL